MSRLDDRLTQELERAARPADPSGVFERIDRRRTRRHAIRRAQAAALAVVVIIGSVGGFVYLTKAFDPGRTPGEVAPIRNGLLIVSMVDPSDHYDLYAVDPANGNRRQLTTGPTDDSGAAVSPDGRTIAFDRVDDKSSGADSGIYTIGIDGTGLRRIADAPANDPTWSPDGSRIAFQRPAPGPNGIWTMNPDGSDPKLIPGTDTLETGTTTWSPDGTSIAFEAGHLVGQGALTWDLYTVPLDATGAQDLHRLTDTPDLNEILPSWSPDGMRIVFSQVAPRPSVNGTGGIAVMSADGGDITFVTEGGPDDRNPAWSPDGSLIAFDRSSPEAQSVYTIQPDGTDLTRVVDGIQPAWQPIPPGADPSPVESPTPTSIGPVDLGLGFPVCDIRSISADFDGDGIVDTASVATKMSDAPDCPAPGTSTEVLVVDLNGDGKADATGGPLACPTGCEPFAAPDVNGDGLPEIAIVVGRPGDGKKRIQLWGLTTPPGGSLAVIPFVDANGDPATFSWGTVNNWGGHGPETFGVSCTSRTSPPLVTEWQAIPTGPGSWHISEHGYHVVGAALRSAFEDSYDVPGEETVFPDGGGDTICGVPVQPAG